MLLTDTAGLRDETQDEIEKMGMLRSLSEIGEADVLVWVRAPGIDETVGPARAPDLVVHNKSDLGEPHLIHVRNESDIRVSVKTGEGLDRLRSAIQSVITGRFAGAENAILVRERHRTSVTRSIRHLNSFVESTKKSAELRAEDLRRAAWELSAITGRVDVEDLLGKIFSEFCIGK